MGNSDSKSERDSWLNWYIGIDGIDVVRAYENIFDDASDTFTGVERNLFATIDSGVDNASYTANNFIATVGTTLQIPIFFAMVISGIAIIRILQIVKNPKTIEALSKVLSEVITLIRANIPRASISTGST